MPLKEAIAEWFGDVLVEYYGFTEGGMTVVRRDEWRDRPGTVGRPLPGMAVRDPRRRRPRACRPNVEGTVYFAPSKGRMFRYQGDDAKTEGAHAGDAFTVGDIGTLDDDGFLYLCGRAADVVVSAGVNVYPAEIEQALSRRTRASPTCRGRGSRRRARRGDRAVRRAAAGRRRDGGAARRSRRRRPSGWRRTSDRGRSHVVDEIPRDQTGKLLRRVLRDRLWHGKQQFVN